MSGVGRGGGEAWGAHNGLTPSLRFSHNLGRVFPPALFDKHPEFFPEENGKRIRPSPGTQWWHPDLGREDVAAHAADVADVYFREHTEAVSFALGVNDGLTFGDSREMRAWTTPIRWFRKRPDFSNLVFTFMNRVAVHTAGKHPDKYLGALAYYWCEDAPDFPVDPHVIPFLTADRSQGYNSDFVTEDQALQTRWVAALKKGAARYQQSGGESPPIRIGVYDYIYGSGFLLPRFHPHLLAAHLRYVRRLGFTDYYAEVYPNWGLDGPQPWLVAQLLQDPDQSADKLLDEYYRRYFKEAAGPMRRFYERCETQWMNQSGPSYWLKYYRNEEQAVLFPREVCRELRGYLDQAMGLAKKPIVQARLQQVSDAFGVTERFVAMQDARDQLNRAVLNGEAEPEVLWSGLIEFQRKRADFVHYTTDLQQQQPLLIAPFKMDDYLMHDPTINLLVRLANAGYRPPPDNSIEALADERLLEDLAMPRSAVLRNGALMGPDQPPRMMADLRYSISLPKEWSSKVEPVEFQSAQLVGESPRILRLTGNKMTTVFQWNWTRPGEFAVAGVKLRGKLSLSSRAILSLSWMGIDKKVFNVKRQLLPTGTWPDWVTLWQGAQAPQGAIWVGIGLTVTDQAKGDWLEAKDFQVEVTTNQVAERN